MIQIQQVLCPVDFSDFSRRGLGHAIAIAKWYGATITLLHVHPTLPIAPVAAEVMPPMVLTRELRTQLLESLRTFGETQAAAGVALRYEVLEGNVAATITSIAHELKADLVVLGTHGTSGFERWLLGSITEKVLRKSMQPVLTVPRGNANAVPVPPLFKRILCAIDFSKCSMRALEYAAALAQEADACLTVAHVFELEGDLPEHWRKTLTPPSVRRRLMDLEEERREQLARAVPADVGAYCTIKTIMAGGTPYREIVRLAAAEESDLIVMGVHGRNAADVMFFGSTTNHVVRQAACPVLTIRHG